MEYCTLEVQKTMKETKFTIENLVKALLALTDEDFCEPDEETYVRYAKTTPATEECEEMANALLIRNGGRCNWANIKALHQYGFDVYAGEKDSFGLLTGCIGFPDGKVLVYG